MTGFRTIPIDPTICKEVRSTLKSPQYGHPAHVESAAGYGPCRACLKQFRVGAEDRILFTYNPFAGFDGYPSPGPVFIHAGSCEAFAEADNFPEELRGLPLTLEAFGDDRWILGRERPHPQEIEEAIQKCFAIAGVRYIHVRNTEAGCFIARIERHEMKGQEL
ncbi:MAG TPA: DUF1203 domain-containing protein [Candidatus Sulfotelmatobacter sp.]|jgi:hypothetical protein|nr:DUF1203 domain-containing protein [Candidatus Sulfotelmatobacter sp.]